MSALIDHMSTVRPADEVGPVLAGRSQAEGLRIQVERLASQSARVVVDFSGVAAASPSWADEFFAKLDPDLVAQQRVQFANVPRGLAAIARFVKKGR
jgi:hypothetical protein